ncbi:MAG: rhomboid family intramembrane serine protease [Oscillospiraceae bacterium]|nr:rhomboid family intramembrane serine protease [Oscillospiraceae bacterium]
MKNIRRDFNRFCYRHRDKGIPNLMLFVCLGIAAVYLINQMDPSRTLYYWLSFDRSLILRGQVWRLFSYIFLDTGGTVFWTAIMLIFYYTLGQGIENVWGTLRLNLFYFTGILIMDVYCLIFGGNASAYYLHLSLFLAYATLFPDAQFMILFVIPVKSWVLALIDLVMILLGVINFFPYNFFPLIALANYFLAFGKDCRNLLPPSWRLNARRAVKKVSHPKTVPFNTAGSYQATHAKVKAPYTHKCTVCGRTDVDSPDLEFRYCSRCKGYHCYCSEHISNHAHITE